MMRKNKTKWISHLFFLFHFHQKNQDVKSLLGKSGIKPELLPAEEDIKKLERRVKSADCVFFEIIFRHNCQFLLQIVDYKLFLTF